MKAFELMNLQLFAGTVTNPYDGVASNVQTTGLAATGTNDLSPTMKTFYRTSLLENARSEHYFNQFGQKQPLPKNGGNAVEWRKFDTFDKALTPLTEGVTPDGNKVNMTKIVAPIAQYGDYTTVSDRLELEAVDPVITAVTEEHGAQAGDTLDIITRNELMKGTHVLYAGGAASRSALASAKTKITGLDINKAVTHLKKMKAPKINGKYVAIIHPSVAMDLREDTAWVEAHKYAATTEIFNGEIGELHGMRFIEDTEAPVIASGSIKVYAMLCFGKDAYGIIDPSAESMEIIVKQRGSAGTADPLDQRSTVGWKATHAAKILYQERLLRVETCSSFEDADAANYTA